LAVRPTGKAFWATVGGGGLTGVGRKAMLFFAVMICVGAPSEGVPVCFSETPMIERKIELSFAHRVLFTRGAFEGSNETLRELFEAGRADDKDQKVLVLADEGLQAKRAGLKEEVKAYFETMPEGGRMVGEVTGVPGAEGCKNDWKLVRDLWEAIDRHELCRHSYVVAIGGGAFLDLAGFAASTAHRGIRLVRMPTTTLSQADGGVGVKNGVNYFGKKNWVGTFSVPFAVVNDLDFLMTLPVSERRAGIIEAIKVALIRDRLFFEAIEHRAEALAVLEEDALEVVVRRSAELHVDHIATCGDPFELGSARPLDFGHWVAHKLEQLSDFALGHGQAVAIGMAVDLIYSARIGLLERETAERILGLMERVGFELWSDFLLAPTEGRSQLAVLRGLEEFREHLGGELTITLVPEVGQKLEVHEMEEAEILGALEELAARVRGGRGEGAVVGA
jgi:3-dehydroquinate synthase